MKIKNTQYRQGDVFIKRIASLPKNTVLVARENGKVVLAHGEVTGHAHAFTEEGVSKLTTDKGGDFFKISGTDMCFTLPATRIWKNQAMVNHPEYGIMEFAICDVLIHGNMVEVDGNFALLKHDEHTAHAIPSGLYEGGRGTDKSVHQREYSPAGIRNTAD